MLSRVTKAPNEYLLARLVLLVFFQNPYVSRIARHEIVRATAIEIPATGHSVAGMFRWILDGKIWYILSVFMRFVAAVSGSSCLSRFFAGDWKPLSINQSITGDWKYAVMRV
jgi:hypothetical protein